MALNQQPGTQDVKDPTTGNFDSLPPQIAGNRDLWSVIDHADAARFLIPAAALQNAAGKFVRPTDASMAAAVKDMTVNPDGITRSMNYAGKDPAAYPLTMVIYAMVPTGGISKAKAGHRPVPQRRGHHGPDRGHCPGELAPGYLPLPQSLREQTLKAADEVLDQTGNPKPKPTPRRPLRRPRRPRRVGVTVRLAVGVAVGKPRGKLDRRLVQPSGRHRDVLGGARPARRRASCSSSRAGRAGARQPGGTRRDRRRRPQDRAHRRARRVRVTIRKRNP